ESPASKRIVRQTAYEVAGQRLVSWKSNEYLYKRDPCPLPTRARGLFTGGPEGDETIVARGYDKFFNIGEVARTKWDWIETHTRGPYELSVKEDGYLILAAGIDEGRTLLVTSKHAVNVPQSEAALAWAQRHLAQVGRSAEELAGFLHENSATAVFELCDDEFEESILEYPDRTRGLYLHGIIRNSVDQAMWPSAEVTRVAERFGFHATQYFTFDSAAEGRTFADQVRRDHVLDGRAIEGFVVRCQTAAGGRPFMFKIKFDSYMLFHEWRDMTNYVVANKSFRTRYALTEQYAAWVREQLKANPEAFDQFGKNKGIIAARKRFIEYYLAHGNGCAEEVYEPTKVALRVLLMPVATIGCGKTTVALALSALFGVGHVQSDGAMAKKKPNGTFHGAVLRALENHTFVFADRTNYMAEVRQSLTADIHDKLPGCRIVALYWPHDRASEDTLLAAAAAHSDPCGEEYRGVMRSQLRRFEPLDLESISDGLVDEVIELDPLADAATNLQAAVDGLCALFPGALRPPSPADVARALETALQQKPTLHMNVGGQS
ncbi:trna ligase, partial [Coemansia nantahalensis]